MADDVLGGDSNNIPLSSGYNNDDSVVRSSFHSPQSATRTTESLRQPAFDRMTNAPDRLEPSDHDVSPELIAAITARVKKELVEHIYQTGNAENLSRPPHKPQSHLTPPASAPSSSTDRTESFSKLPQIPPVPRYPTTPPPHTTSPIVDLRDYRDRVARSGGRYKASWEDESTHAFTGEFNSPRDAERWDRFQESRPERGARSFENLSETSKNNNNWQREPLDIDNAALDGHTYGIAFLDRKPASPSPDNGDKQQGSWGLLFDRDGKPTMRLMQVLKGIANYIVEHFVPRKSIVIAPEKMAAFYNQYMIETEPHPWLTVFRSRSTDLISRLYQDLDCEYHLVQEGSPTAPPTVPALTCHGFAQWMLLQILAFPEQEATRLQKVVMGVPIDADVDFDAGKSAYPERLPKYLPRRLLPDSEDPSSRKKVGIAIDRLFSLMARDASQRGRVPRPQSGDSVTRQERMPYTPPASESSNGETQSSILPSRQFRRPLSPPLVGSGRTSKLPPLSASMPVSPEHTNKYKSSGYTSNKFERESNLNMAQGGGIAANGEKMACTECRRRKQKCNKPKDQPCSNCVRRYPPVICAIESSASRKEGRLPIIEPTITAIVPRNVHSKPPTQSTSPNPVLSANNGKSLPSVGEQDGNDGIVIPTQQQSRLSSITTPEAYSESSAIAESTLSRLSRFLKPTSQKVEDVLTQRQGESSGPDLFVQNAEIYTGSVVDLQSRIFELGKSTLSALDTSGSIHVLSLPLLTDPNELGELGDIELLQRMISHNLRIVSAILEGLEILAKEEFSGDSYSIVVLDPERSDVLRAVPVRTATLQLFKDLLSDAANYYACSEQHSLAPGALLSETMSDLHELLNLVVQDLGLGQALVTKQPIGAAMLLDQTSSTLATLFFGLVSFVASHISCPEPDLTSQAWTQLRIDTPSCPIFMTPRRLLCLDGFVKQPIWTFRAADSICDINMQEGKRYYLSILLADFTDLWGPIRIEFIDNKLDRMAQIMVRGGIIQALPLYTRHTDHQVDCRTDEILCHWHSWMDIGPEEWRGPMSTDKRLLIGSPDLSTPSVSNSRVFNGHYTCNCGRNIRYADSYNAFELGTKLSSWSVSEKMAQVSGGAYINILYGHTWKFNAGWTLKDVIIVDWLDHLRESSHTPKPFYLDYRSVLDVSQCTGHSRRISMWALIKQKNMHRYLRKSLRASVYNDFDMLVQFFPASAPFTDVWNSISQDGQEIFKIVVQEILGILRSTGVGEDGRLQAWDITTFDRLDGRRLDPRWVAMVKDDSACATFAIITDSCPTYASSLPIYPQYTSRLSPQPTLRTTICITHASLEDSETYIYTPPDSLKDDDCRPEWALSTPIFEKWKVKLSEDNYGGKKSQRLLESLRDASGPVSQGLWEIESRRSARTHRLQSNNDKIEAPNSKSKEVALTNGACSEIANIKQPISPIFTAPQKSRLNGSHKRLGHSLCDRPLDFKNGKGEEIGKLVFDSPQIDLHAATEERPLTARWEARKSGFLTSIKAKEQVIDKKIVDWTEKKPSGLLPWAISRVADSAKPTPFVVEHIRGGSVSVGQKVLETFIR